MLLTAKCKYTYLGTVMYGSNVANIFSFHIVPHEVKPLLSGAAAEALGVISLPKSDDVEVRKEEVSKSVDRVLQQFPECLQGVGLLKGYHVKFNVDETIAPAASPPRPVPFHLKGQLRKELDKMLADSILEEHHGPAPWVSNIVLPPRKKVFGLRWIRGNLTRPYRMSTSPFPE